MLALGTVALIAYLELDSVRDVKGIEVEFELQAAFVDGGAHWWQSSNSVDSSNLSPPVRFMDVMPLALLGIHIFYGAGQHSTISSLQMENQHFC